MAGSLTTARLLGEPAGEGDFVDLRALHADPRVMATLSTDGRPLSEEQTRARLQRFAEHWRLYGYGVWLFRDRCDGRFVGYCGLQRTRLEGADEVELLYAVVSGRWGQGLATEMARAAVEFARTCPGMRELVCFTLPGNLASRCVMEHVGFCCERDITHAGLPHVLYRLRLL